MLRHYNKYLNLNVTKMMARVIKVKKGMQ